MPLQGNARPYPTEAPDGPDEAGVVPIAQQVGPLPPTGDELVARARALHPLVASHAERGERERRVAQESIDALTDAGLFRMPISKRFGGYESSLRTMLEVSATVAEADGGTAWVLALCTAPAWFVGKFSEQAQDEVWKDNPDARVSGVLSPHAQTVRVDGGLRVTGRWYYNSGSWHSDWAALAVPLSDAAGNVVDQGAILLPRRDVTIEDTWFVAGMRSSESNCIVADDVFVPEHRVASLSQAIGGQDAGDPAVDILHRSAAIPLVALTLAAPQLGLGRRALEIVRAKAADKNIAYTSFTAQSDSVAFQLQLADAAMMIDTAHLHVYRAADEVDAAARAGTFPDLASRIRMRADAAWAVHHVTKAIDILLTAHGAAGFAECNPLQRIWRDSAVAARHAVILPPVNQETYGKALLGRTDHITSLI